MNPERQKITVSTDVLGFWADPVKVLKLYSTAGFWCNLEIVAMLPQRQPIINQSRGLGNDVEIGGIHGQLGPVNNPKTRLDALKITIADLLLPNVMGKSCLSPLIPVGLRLDMIGQIQENDPYFNVHNSVVEKDFDRFLKFARFLAYSHLTIENGGEKGDWEKTVALINRLRDLGAERTTGTFDLVHAVVEIKGGNFSFKDVVKAWPEVLMRISGEFRHLHFPIGTNDDSLPIMDMLDEKKMLTDLLAKIRELKIEGITIENQHSLVFGANVQREITRLSQIRDKLNELEFGL